MGNKAGEPWDPSKATPVGGYSPILLVDAENGTHYTDAGSTPAGDGDAVYTITDDSGNDYDLIQTTANYRPLLLTDVLNGNAVFRFDGANDSASVAYGTTYSQPCTVIFVFRISPDDVNDNNQHNFFDTIHTDYRQSFYAYAGDSPDSYTIYAGSGASHISPNAGTDPAWHVVSIVFLDGAPVLRLDGENKSLSDPAIGPDGQTGFMLGARFDGWINSHIDIAFVSVYNAALSTGDLVTIENYIENRFFKNDFVFEVTTTEADTFTLPLRSTGTYNFTINWGDGGSDTITAYDQAEITHSYAQAGVYECRIRGVCSGWQFNNTGDRLLITDIKQWGCLLFGSSAAGAFYGCSNMYTTATDEVDVSGVMYMQSMFRDCYKVNPVTTNWDTSAVTSMYYLFASCHLAEPDVSNWNVGSVTDFESMFNNAETLNPDVSGWDVSSALSFRNLFRSAASANPDVSSWDVSACLDFGAMFRGASSANPDVSSWVTSSATTMDNMFYGTSCNPDVSGFDMTSVGSIGSMFVGNTNANPDMSSWNIVALTNASSFLPTVNALSTTNYSNALIAWALLSLQSGVTIDLGDAKYSAGAAATARASIISSFSWTINDGGQA